MNAEQQSVDAQSADTEADEHPAICVQHRQAQADGEVFQGRQQGEK
ncbi:MULTISPECIES: hypothetical protein [unclassified Haloarcula]|nr:MULTISPECIES: hypothetical protein [unclassified Haloarcula]